MIALCEVAPPRAVRMPATRWASRRATSEGPTSSITRMYGCSGSRGASTPQSLASTRRPRSRRSAARSASSASCSASCCAALSSTTRLQAASALSPRFRRSCTCSASSGSSSISRWVTKISRIAFTVLRSTRPTISSSTARLARSRRSRSWAGDSPRGWNSKRCATWTCAGPLAMPGDAAIACRRSPARSGAGRASSSASPTASGKASSASASTSSPSPSRTAASKAGSASSAIAGSALNSSVWPRRAPRASSLLRLFAETGAASLSARRTRISPAKPLASCASACAGRACRPCGLARTARALGQSGGSSPPSAASTLRLLVARTSSAPRPSSNRSHRRSSSAWCASPRLARQNSPVTSCPWCCNGCAGVTKASPGRFTNCSLCNQHSPSPSGNGSVCWSTAAKPFSTQPAFFNRRAPSQASSSRSSAFWPRPTSCASSASSCGAPCNRPRTSSALAAALSAGPRSASPRARVSNCRSCRCSSDFAAMPMAR